MEWNKKPCAYLKTILRQVQNGEQTQELRLPEEMPDIGRVICGWGQPVIRSKQWRGDGISVTGGVSGSVMYLPEDGTFARTLEVWLPFQMKWNLPPTQRDGTMRFQCLLKSMDARTLSARKMMVRATVSILAEALENAETDIYSPGALAPDIEVLTNTYPAVLPREAGEKLFAFEEDVHIPNVKKWISWRLDPQINEKNVVGERAIIRGNGQLHYVYMTEDGSIHSGRQDIPFAQFMELDREYDRDASVDILLALSGLETEQNEEGVHIVCNMAAQYLVWDRMLLEVSEDAYSPMRSVEITTEDLSLPMELDSRGETVQAQMSFQNGNVLDVTFFADHPTPFREGDTVNVGMSGTFQILYEDDEGSLQAALENWSEEMTFPTSANTQLFTTVRSVDAQETGRNVELVLGLQTISNQSIPMITELTAGEQKTRDEGRPTLVLRRMNQQTLWDLAKSSGSTMDAIRKANGLTQEPEQGQMVLIPII